MFSLWQTDKSSTSLKVSAIILSFDNLNILIYLILLILENILSNESQLIILKLDISRKLKESHPLNIPLISVTKEVSKLDKSNDFNELQLENIFDIVVTEEVVKLVKSTDSNETQFEKSEFMSVTEDELKFEKSMDTTFAMFSSIL